MSGAGKKFPVAKKSKISDPYLQIKRLVSFKVKERKLKRGKALIKKLIRKAPLKV